ncbi:uncharacterized protein LOC124169490 [Ischnura elegans]|uniref:uncharacterized protein LOC124169490 n=1 Tax=Ischnura elegans TaxID=197161 RepID=UPI001ED8B80F|nr:uncharacterized protein LOC124169490 [Ischnura elegans]
MHHRTFQLLLLLFAASARCEPNFRWKILRQGDASEGTTIEIMNDETMEKHNLRILQNPCNCESLMCKCCAGFNIEQMNFAREGCMIFGFNPMEFSLDMMILMNDNMLWNNSLSAKNPPPICLPIVIPGVPTPRLEMCMKLYDIYFPGQNIHLCMDLDTKMMGSTLLLLHFDCMRMGADGWALMKPGDKVELVDIVDEEDTIYDLVNEPGEENAPSEGSVAVAEVEDEAAEETEPADPTSANESRD